MALFPTPQESCFYLDPNAGLTDGNLWKDSGPHGLHVTPVNFTAPNWGISTGPSGAKMITFNGTNQRGTLPLRWYTNAPTTAVTVAVVARYNAPAASDRIFNATNAGGTLGFVLRHSVAERLHLYCLDAVSAVTLESIESDDAPLTSRTRVSVLSARQSTALRWVDRVGRAATGSANANPVAYDVAGVPTVGAVGGGGAYFDGDLYCLGIFSRVWSDSEAKAFADYWRERT